MFKDVFQPIDKIVINNMLLAKFYLFNRYNYISLLVVFLFFLALGLLRSQNAFENEYMSLAFPGDGHGTIANFDGYNKSLYEDGFWQLLVDRWHPEFGGGYHAPGLVSFFWRFTGLFLSQLEPDDIYDASVVLLYVLNGLTAYLLARYLRLNHYYAFLSAIFIVSLENFDSRITGHLTLAAYFGFILAIVFLFEATKNPNSLKKTILLGMFIAFSFAINEYYGLFVLEISVVYYFIAVWRKTNLLFTLKKGIICSLSFLFTLTLFYPFTLLGPLLSKFDKTVSYPTRIMYKSDYLHYSLHNPLELFKSNFDIFSAINQWITKTNYFLGNGGEFTYRIGFSILIFIVLFVILHKIVFSKILFNKLLRKLSPFLLLYFLTIIISIHPEHPYLGKISFVNLHMEYSSILRVNSRAMVLGNVFLILMLGIVVNEFSRNILNTHSNRILKILVPLVLLVPFTISIADARNLNFRPWERWNVQPMPKSVEFVEELKNFPSGMTMEIPYHQDNIPPETTYIHALNSAYHGNDITNFIGGSSYRNIGLRWWSREVNHPNKNTIEKIKQSGIKYIIVWNNPEKLPFGRNVDFDSNFYRNAFGLKKLFSAEIGTIYEVIGVKSYNKKEFGKFINNTPSQGKYSHQLMYIVYPDKRIVDSYNNLKFILTEEDINRYIMYGPYDVFDKGNYQFSFQFENISFVNKDAPCLKLEVLSNEDGMLAETTFSHNDLQKMGKQIDFEVFLNSLGSLEFRVMPLCQGEIVFSEITFRKTNIIN